ncbi:DIS3-like exonuclease 1 [Mya arenaria]|uniref:DIS3-like exonuclease 1 n=1 Tax=Mya arenaria TaxID=6604 RepID=UPI0022E0C218|nr:DIS3-like exonuclease 1 [Mya arenaria]XP_052794966.1 DIS3-like exonuclease 1 [Mya arenaria]
MLEKSDRRLRLKNVHGKSVCVVREVYRREDIPCQSEACIARCQNTTITSGPPTLLPKDITHYVIPDPQTAREYLEIFESHHIRGIIFTQTAAHSVQHDGSRRLHSRLKNLIKDRRRGSVIFHNEFQTYAYCEREPGEKLSHWHVRATYKTADWYFNHLAASIPIVMVTSDEQFIHDFGHKTPNLFVLTMRDYLEGFWAQLVPEIMELYQSLHDSSKNKTKDVCEYVGYLPADILAEGLKTGKYIQGFINVNKSNSLQEAFIRRAKKDLTEDSGSDILISGMVARNRAVHGDLVVMELLPRAQWQGRSTGIQNPGEKGSGDNANVSDMMPTGRVVGITQRNWREYVACFSQDEEVGRGDKKAGKLLVIPWDYRIPKIRISTRQVDALKDHRIIVRIDSWDIDSTYPNGHFVRSLGKIGDLEAEVAAILVENDIRVQSFSEAQLLEMPVDTPLSPWTMDSEEVTRRRDLRESHLIFSIDPKGCEDVDDTLSVRTLPNGNTELGVHIADVTYFVEPGSLTDQEAQSRSTTVYLADRRYDMLPGVLSANLCSLVSGVDRYAVSVIWELDRNYEVVDVWYGRTVIRSQYKLFYELAQAIHEGIVDAEVVRSIPELHNLWGTELDDKVQELRETVDRLMQVARGLKSRRVKGGALELESVEVQVQLSETKSIENLNPKQHLEVHDTIAECMIFANHWVAKKIAETFPNQSLLRHHPLPKEEQFTNLNNCAASRGFEIKTSTNKELAESLDRCVDSKDPVVNKILRSLATQAMSNAAYFCTGVLPRDQFFHYGLALDMYTHFTSPIRRYADVIVHRQLLEAVANEKKKTTLPSCTELESLSQHINTKHRASQYAQRESQELFQCLFFRGRGTEDDQCVVDAVIFQLRVNGVLVFVPRYGIKGPVYLRSKQGEVVHVGEDGAVEWTAGQVIKMTTHVMVDSVLGQQKYDLLDHITVKLSLQDSWAHASSLRLELVSNLPLKQQPANMETVAKQQKADIIQEVTSEAVEKRLQLESYDLGQNFPQLKQEYGQSKSSLYEMFSDLRTSALQPPTT